MEAIVTAALGEGRGRGGDGRGGAATTDIDQRKEKSYNCPLPPRTGAPQVPTPAKSIQHLKDGDVSHLNEFFLSPRGCWHL